MKQTDPIYKEMILYLYKNPLNKKQLADFDCSHKEYNPSCGDEIEIMIKFDESGKIIDIGHQGEGCAVSQAAVSLLTEEVKGKSKEEVMSLTEEEMINMLEIPISHTRSKCALLGLKTILFCFDRPSNKTN